MRKISPNPHHHFEYLKPFAEYEWKLARYEVDVRGRETWELWPHLVPLTHASVGKTFGFWFSLRAALSSIVHFCSKEQWVERKRLRRHLAEQKEIKAAVAVLKSSLRPNPYSEHVERSIEAARSERTAYLDAIEADARRSGLIPSEEEIERKELAEAMVFDAEERARAQVLQ